MAITLRTSQVNTASVSIKLPYYQSLASDASVIHVHVDDMADVIVIVIVIVTKAAQKAKEKEAIDIDH